MKKVFRLIIILILLVVIGLSIYLLYKSPNIGLLGKKVEIPDKDYNYVLGKEDNKSYSVKEYQRMDISKINIWDLKKQNSDTVDWIQVDATKINYPVLQYTDNEYYLKHDIYGTYMITGWIFMDYRNDSTNLSKNTIIYGHNTRSGYMFGDLKNALDSGWYTSPNNQIITFNTLNKEMTCRLYSDTALS